MLLRLLRTHLAPYRRAIHSAVGWPSRQNGQM